MAITPAMVMDTNLIVHFFLYFMRVINHNYSRQQMADESAPGYLPLRLSRSLSHYSSQYYLLSYFEPFRTCTEVDISARTVGTAVVAIESITNVCARDVINLPAPSVHTFSLGHRVELTG